MALLTFERNPSNVAKRLRSDELWMNFPRGLLQRGAAVKIFLDWE
jgi:hypothetical protein